MRAYMVLKYQCCGEDSRTKLAPERGDASMHDHCMALQIGECSKSTVALATFVFLVSIFLIVLHGANVHVTHTRTEIIETSSAVWTSQQIYAKKQE